MASSVLVTGATGKTGAALVERATGVDLIAVRELLLDGTGCAGKFLLGLGQGAAGGLHFLIPLAHPAGSAPRIPGVCFRNGVKHKKSGYKIGDAGLRSGSRFNSSTRPGKNIGSSRSPMSSVASTVICPFVIRSNTAPRLRPESVQSR